MTPFLGELRTFGFNFAPVGWASCMGQLLPVAENNALFALIGTTYGGDGQSTFGLPDLRGRMPLHQGQGPGQPSYAMGERAGSTDVTLTSLTMPAHTHIASATVSQASHSGAGTLPDPIGAIPSGSAEAENFATPSLADGGLAPMQITPTVAAAGGNLPFSNMPPFLCINICISLEGIFPSRS